MSVDVRSVKKKMRHWLIVLAYLNIVGFVEQEYITQIYLRVNLLQKMMMCDHRVHSILLVG